MKLCPFGVAALFLDLEIERDPDRAARTLAAARHLASRLPSIDVAVGAGVLVLAGVGAWDELAGFCAEAARAAAAPLSATPAAEDAPLVIDACYDGPDLAAVAAALSVSTSEVTALHAGADYRVELLGFLPGFAYLGPVPPALALPRRPSPRPSVPAGSIGVAGGFTGVYPSASPGGWHLLGRAVGFRPFDPARRPPLALRPGQRVRFAPTDHAPAPPSPPSPPSPSAPPITRGRYLEVLVAASVSSIQDGGRAGMLSAGLPPSGPLDRQAFTAANLAVGNDAGAAAIEVALGRLELRAHGALMVSIDGEPAVALAEGDRVVIAPSARAVRYLAARGGVDVPLVLGSRSTLLAARLGGLEGRPLRKGDAVPVGDQASGRVGGAAPAVVDPPELARLLVEPGPHLDRFPDGAFEQLLAGEFRVSRHGDRVGVRLDGARITTGSSALLLPVPMVRGAIEIATDGTPIVLGPDHPTTGGYPVLGALARASQALLGRLRPGHRVRLELA